MDITAADARGYFEIIGGRKMATKKSIKITPYDTPWEVACMIINAEYLSKNVLGQEIVLSYFNKADLRRIGEHLLNYCNAEMEESQ